MLSKLDQFHQTRRGHAVFGLVELLMAYGFVDWALDTGNWLWWIVAAFLVVGAVQNFVQAIRGPKR
jgi:hypothetical protein